MELLSRLSAAQQEGLRLAAARQLNEALYGAGQISGELYRAAADRLARGQAAAGREGGDGDGKAGL